MPPAVAVAWGMVNGMGSGAGGALTFGLAGFARNAPILTLLMSLGPVLLPALVAFVPDRRLPTRPVMLAGCGLAVGLGLLYFVMLSEKSWVGFRAGQILLVMLTVPLANVVGRLLVSRRVAAWTLAVAVLAIGAPTVLIDLHNASDIGNRSMGPGFPWTLTVSPAQQEALAWVRTNTPDTAIVQMDPTGARTRPLELHPHVCPAPDGGRLADLAPARSRVSRSIARGTRNVSIVRSRPCARHRPRAAD